MRTKGNGDIGVCVDNLLRTFRGEVPYERLKGIDARALDRPTQDAEASLIQEGEWCIENYEPRATVESIEVMGLDSGNGAFQLVANIAEA